MPEPTQPKVASVPLADYQHIAVETFLRALPSGTKTIVELGSDLEAKVARTLAGRTSARVYGLNPSPEFPRLASGEKLPDGVVLLREDGRKIPLPDASVEAVFTVATIEHVIGLDDFYAEISRVLKPGGLLHADFGPLWSSAQGHHTFAVIEGKEARYWKAGRNLVPDYLHLLFGPDEMRTFLQDGPCDTRLVEPIIFWLYSDEGINRCFLEEHLQALESSGLSMQRLRLKPGIIPERAIHERLRTIHGSRNYIASGVEATMRKPTGSMIFAWQIRLKKMANTVALFAQNFARSFYHSCRQFDFLRNRLEKIRGK